MPRRTDAFTLQELLVVMILSGILLATTYYGLQTVQQYYQSFNRRSERTLRYQTLHHLLQRDFRRAEYIVRQDKAIVCYLTNGTITYDFTDEAVVRTQGELHESFPGSAQDMQAYFRSEPMVLNNHPIDKLRFTLTVQEEVLPFRIQKTYAADQLMKLNQWPD